MNIRYKLTNQNLTTYMGFQWVLNEWKETSGFGDLCTPGWLHCYTHPLLAVLLNVVHADIENPRLFKCEVEGKTKTDHGMKEGWTRMRLVEEIEVPKITVNQRIAFGILCAIEASKDEKFIAWANNWLSGKDRSAESANSTYVNYAKYVHGESYTPSIYYACSSANWDIDEGFESFHCSSKLGYYPAKSACLSVLQAEFSLSEIAEKAMEYK